MLSGLISQDPTGVFVEIVEITSGHGIIPVPTLSPLIALRPVNVKRISKLSSAC
jgi:hypothetical protein